MSENAATPPSKSVGLWVGLGCLGVLVFSCCLLTFWAQSYGLRFVLGQDDGTKVWFSRMILVGALEGTRKTCRDGVVSEDTLPWFHQELPAESRNLICSLDETTLQALSTAERASATPLLQTDGSELAARFGMDAAQCFQHSTDGLTAIGCFDTESGPGSIPYQIIDLRVTQP